jgi:hypothetical protein
MCKGDDVCKMMAYDGMNIDDRDETIVDPAPLEKALLAIL